MSVIESMLRTDDSAAVANDAEQRALVAELRETIGRQAHEDVAENRRIEVAAQAWANVLREVVADRAGVS
jgi:hypothetical protein